MKEAGDTDEDREARALLNKFLGASVLMSGMEAMMPRDVKKTITSPHAMKKVRNELLCT